MEAERKNEIERDGDTQPTHKHGEGERDGDTHIQMDTHIKTHTHAERC